MKHLEALRMLPLYFEGALDRDTSRALHEHLKTCTDCRDQIKAMRKFKLREMGNPASASETPGRRRSRLLQERGPDPRHISSLNAHHLAMSRRNQRRLALQFLLAAATFFLAARLGLFELLMR